MLNAVQYDYLDTGQCHYTQIAAHGFSVTAGTVRNMRPIPIPVSVSKRLCNYAAIADATHTTVISAEQPAHKWSSTEEYGYAVGQLDDRPAHFPGSTVTFLDHHKTCQPVRLAFSFISHHRRCGKASLLPASFPKWLSRHLRRPSIYQGAPKT